MSIHDTKLFCKQTASIHLLNLMTTYITKTHHQERSIPTSRYPSCTKATPQVNLDALSVSCPLMREGKQAVCTFPGSPECPDGCRVRTTQDAVKPGIIILHCLKHLTSIQYLGSLNEKEIWKKRLTTGLPNTARMCDLVETNKCLKSQTDHA